MRLRVQMFGALRERAGRGEEVLDLPDGSTGTDLLRVVAERHPEASPLLDKVSLAVNLEVVPPDRELAAADEVALLPPVAGGAGILVGLREEPSVSEALAAVADPEAGGTAIFLGTVRDHSDAGAVERLEYEAYEEMAQRSMRAVAEEARERWSLSGAAILHAVGNLEVGRPTIVAACAAPHREEAFEACRFLVDEVKSRLPVWKKERGPWGERWVNL
ncbi:MAG TPA: molybdenum cofactor biosynthesis protein MoaE [Actinomycetota bacterium]|nr:molybdenum cofactor biosynthesis protein MoaE [Actinomycetota bacterium]